MTPDALHVQQGLAAQFWRPTINVTYASPNTLVYAPKGEYIGTFNPITYSHDIRAVGGFWSCQITMAADQLDAEDWLWNGLNRHVEILGPGGMVVWEGFVDGVIYGRGALSIEHGPVMDIANRADARYTRTFTGTNPPETGASAMAGLQEVGASQEDFGFLDTVLTLGAEIDSRAVGRVTAYLYQNAWGNLNRRYSSQQNVPPNITLRCLGYVHRLDHTLYYYEGDGEVDLSDKLAHVLDYEPNGLITSANADIELNALQVPVNDDTFRSAWTVIKELVGYGNASYERTTFGVYEGRRVRYETPASEVAYHQRVSQPSVINAGNVGQIPLFEVRPGQWLRYLDVVFQPLAPAYPSEFDPRFMFIESARFNLPDELTMDDNYDEGIYNRFSAQGLGTVQR